MEGERSEGEIRKKGIVDERKEREHKYEEKRRNGR